MKKNLPNEPFITGKISKSFRKTDIVFKINHSLFSNEQSPFN